MDESASARNHMKQKLAAGELVLCMNLRLARTVDIAMVAKAGGYDALYKATEASEDNRSSGIQTARECLDTLQFRVFPCSAVAAITAGV